MSDSLFIHLAVRTSYSLLESMLTPKALQKWAEENFIPAVAVTDRNNLFGALEISETLSGAGVQPIMACCFDVTDGAHQEWITQVSLYAQNEAGFQRLMELSSLAYLEAEDGVARLKRGHLFEKTDGLILLTGGSKGEAAQYILKGKQSEAEATLADFAKAYPGRCYVELTRHGEADEANSEPGLIEAAYKLGLPLVATHDVRFMKPGDAKAHDALMCISNGEYLGQDDRKRVSPEQYLKTSAQMVELFSDLPEAIASTVEIAQRCGVRATKRSPILPNFGDGTRSEIDELKLQAREGLDKRLSEAPKLYAERSVYEERLEYELGIIEKMGFPGYFLIVADFIKWAKDNDIPVGPGRGSGAEIGRAHV